MGRDAQVSFDGQGRVEIASHQAVQVLLLGRDRALELPEIVGSLRDARLHFEALVGEGDLFVDVAPDQLREFGQEGQGFFRRFHRGLGFDDLVVRVLHVLREALPRQPEVLARQPLRDLLLLDRQGDLVLLRQRQYGARPGDRRPAGLRAEFDVRVGDGTDPAVVAERTGFDLVRLVRQVVRLAREDLHERQAPGLGGLEVARRDFHLQGGIVDGEAFGEGDAQRLVEAEHGARIRLCEGVRGGQGNGKEDGEEPVHGASFSETAVPPGGSCGNGIDGGTIPPEARGTGAGG